MTFTDRTEPGQSQTLVFEVELAHEPQVVWRALTQPELLSEWLLPIEALDLAPGTRFTFQAPPQPGWDGLVHCRVLESRPHERLRYAWVVGDMDTVVTFALQPTPAGTRLSITHAGFGPQQKQNFGGARYGWKMMGGRLVELLGRAA